MSDRFVRMSAVVGAAIAVGALVGCVGAPEVDRVPPPASEGPLPGTESPSNGAPSNGTEGGISMEEAGQIAVERYGGTITGIEDDTHNGEPTWEVELRDSSEGRIEVEVSKATGEIVSMEKD